MIITALKSNNDHDKRSPVHMETVRSLIDLGVEIWFEEDAGQGINVSNEEFVQAGLKKHTREECLKNGDLILTIQALTNDDLNIIKPHSTILGMVNPFSNSQLINLCAELKINLVSMEFIPNWCWCGWFASNRNCQETWC